MKSNKKIIEGKVVSDKMDKTIVVCVDRIKFHSLYKKKYTSSKKYKVHDEKNQCKEGDMIQFIEIKPKSKDKKFELLKKI
jgi:small subunit ribosomal protein S17